MDATFLAAQGAFTLEDLTPALLIGSLVLLVSVAAVRLSVKSGLPSLLLYLAIGLAIGEYGLGIDFDYAELAQVLGYAALVVILAEGGLSTKWEGIKASVAPAAALATVGRRRLHRRRRRGLPLHPRPSVDHRSDGRRGARSTDAAAVFSVLRRVPLPRRITGLLEAESGFNDAPVVILVVALVDGSRRTRRADAVVGAGLARRRRARRRLADRAGDRVARGAVHAPGGVLLVGLLYPSVSSR